MCGGGLSWLTSGIINARIGTSIDDMSDETNFKTYMCVICGWIYDEAKGSPDDGIAPGTRWDDVPDYWTCPDCGAGKEDFEMIEI